MTVTRILTIPVAAVAAVAILLVVVACLKPLLGNGDFFYLEMDDWSLIRNHQIEWWFDHCADATHEQKEQYISAYRHRYEQVLTQHRGRAAAMQEALDEWNARNKSCPRRAPVVNVNSEIWMCFDGTHYWTPRRYEHRVCFAEDQ